MIVNMKYLLQQARNEGYAIPQFNINNLEWARFILEACEEKKSPVILGVSESTVAYMGGYQTVSHIVEDLVQYLNITIPIVLHLDHGRTIEACKAAIDAGFTSVMIDASYYDITKNIEMTNEVIHYAKKRDVSVEGEIGQIGSRSTDINQILLYVEKTNLDALAPALGSIHGIGKEDINLDFETMNFLKRNIEIPLVLHGASGIEDRKIAKAISCGICKFNVNTDLQIEWTKEVRKFLENNNSCDPRKIIKAGETAMKKIIYTKISLFGSYKKA